MLAVLLATLTALPVAAQQTSFRQAVSGFAGCHEATATVSKTQTSLLTRTTTTSGTLLMRPPSHMCITTDEGRDQLLMEGTAFTMLMGGKRHETDSRTNRQFTAFKQVLDAILSGGTTDVKGIEGVTTSQQGNLLTISIRPQKRLMFTGYSLVIDVRTSALVSMHLRGRLGLRADYEFSNFQFKRD